jgi:hypothetical protein
MSDHAPKAAQASVTAVVGVLAAVGLMLLLVTWAATIGPQEVVTREGNPPSYEPVSSSPPTATPSPTRGGQRAAGGGDHDVLFTVVTIVATVLAGVLMLAVVLTVMRWLLTRDWRRRRERDPEEVAFDPLDAPAALAGAIAAGAGRQRELLATGSPRNAIVACWHDFEESAEAARVRRKPWETSSEFTIRVLDRLSADDAAVLLLAELYRDARHSGHHVTEDSRRAAAEALDAIHRSLGAQARSP